MTRLQSFDNELIYRDINLIYYNTDKLVCEAHPSRNEIWISKGQINLMEYNHNWEAGVIGHELNHIKLNGCHRNAVDCEITADLFGQKLANKAGFDGCQLSSLWDKMIKTYGDNSDEDHPLPSYRAYYLRCK